MEIVYFSPAELKPYGNNPRKNDAAVPLAVQSIQDFGFRVPIVIDKQHTIICGHTRWKAAKKLKLDAVPCIIADDLSKEQIRAYRIIDNRVSEASEWDSDLLMAELTAIAADEFAPVDMDAFGFDIGDFSIDDEEEKPEPDNTESDDDEGFYGDERERTAAHYNLHDVDMARVTGSFDMPVLQSCYHIPKDLISFNYVLNTDAFEKGVHFYVDDYQFERVWSRPKEYFDRLKQFDCVLTPDFSLYTEMPLAMQIWNVYRSRLIGQMMQDAGITVIPTLQWCRADSFAFCFDGIPKRSVVSVSTIGVKQSAQAMALWNAGMERAMQELKPRCVVVYGGDIGFDFGACKALYIENHNVEKIKSAGRKTTR